MYITSLSGRAKRLQAVWADVGLKSSPKFSQSYQKVAPVVFN